MSENSKGKLSGRRIVRTHLAFKRAGICPSTGYEMISRGELPKPFKLSSNGRASGMFEDELDACLEERATESRSNATAV